MSYSPPKYPTSIPDQVTDLPDRTDDIDWIEAWIYNYVKKELVAVMTELGTDPAGTEATVAARLTAIEAAGVDESVIMNIYLNSFRIAILGSYAIMNMAKGISDEYEDDGWKIFSFNRNHVNRTPIFNYYKPNDEETQLVPKVELQAKIDAGTAFELSYFEHGQGAWFRRGTGSERGLQCQWDTAQLAGILIAPDDWKAPEGKTPEEQVDLMLEEYNEWYNGSCYWYAIQNGEKTELDSCSGFIGAYLIEHLKEEHSELWDGDSIKDGIEVVGDAASMVE